MISLDGYYLTPPRVIDNFDYRNRKEKVYNIQSFKFDDDNSILYNSKIEFISDIRDFEWSNIKLNYTEPSKYKYEKISDNHIKIFDKFGGGNNIDYYLVEAIEYNPSIDKNILIHVPWALCELYKNDVFEQTLIYDLFFNK